MSLSNDPWYDDINYGGNPSVCGKNKCNEPAVVVGLASPSHRVVTCAQHEDELKRLKDLIRSSPPPKPNEPAPFETIQWRRDDRMSQQV